MGKTGAIIIIVLALVGVVVQIMSNAGSHSGDVIRAAYANSQAELSDNAYQQAFAAGQQSARGAMQMQQQMQQTIDLLATEKYMTERYRAAQLRYREDRPTQTTRVEYHYIQQPQQTPTVQSTPVTNTLNTVCYDPNRGYFSCTVRR